MSAETPSPERLREALALELPDNDSGTSTVRAYLTKLLLKVWREEEGFDGKRPFGNSSWQYDLYKPLLEAGFASGLTEAEAEELHGGWGIPEAKQAELDALIVAAIDTMGQPQAPEPACRVCDGSGKLTVPDGDGESASEQACPDPIHDRQPAPELAAAISQRDYAERELNKSIDETALLRHLLATVLGEFTKSSDGCHARVSQVTLAKRKKTAGMEITEDERRMIGA